MTKEHEEMLNMVHSAMEIAESRASYVASVRLLFDATVDVMQLEVTARCTRCGPGKKRRCAWHSVRLAVHAKMWRKKRLKWR